ncbi:MAG: VCBS repeat-containing protein [Rhodocyclaceae bacterium]|nr:VCBS repeat-containing protein [Rhodocyclaceae bacterium]
MKIAAYSMDLSSQHYATNARSVSENLKMWVGAQRPDFEGKGRTLVAPADPPRVDISPAARQAQETAPSAEADEGTIGDPMLSLVKSIVEIMIGHKLKLFSAASLGSQGSGTLSGSSASHPTQSAPPAKAGFGIEYDRQETRTEAERTSFQASGSIQTTDGKQISFNLDVQMSRSYSEQSSVSLRAGDAVKKDPLVINFSGTAAQLQDTRFAFDIAGDGQTAKVALLGSGSAYVALDANGNGKVDSGKELFGTANGNGFADLKQYDADGNGWIDDNDPIFSQLKAWSPDAKGGGSLTSLKALGVGALSLSSQTTPFEIKDGANQSLGAVKSTGVYLNENGSAGTLQQIDLTV